MFFQIVHVLSLLIAFSTITSSSSSYSSAATASSIQCGDTINQGNFITLEKDLIGCDCSNGRPALTLQASSKLDLNGYMISCNDVGTVILIDGDKVSLSNGNITIENPLINPESRIGIEIQGHGNHLIDLTISNVTEGIKTRNSFDWNWIEQCDIEVLGSDGVFSAGISIVGNNYTIENCQIQISSMNNGTTVNAGMWVRGSDFLISNSIVNGPITRGIRVTGWGQNNLVMNNQVLDAESGIYIWGNHKTVISYNEVTNCNQGIYLDQGNNNVFTNNVVVNNTICGLNIHEGYGNTVVSNYAESNGIIDLAAYTCDYNNFDSNSYDCIDAVIDENRTNT